MRNYTTSDGLDGMSACGLVSRSFCRTTADNLSDYDVPFALTVTPTNIATLADTAVDATIEITGTDAQGRVQIVRLAFPNASKSDPQTTSTNFIEVTGVSVEGWGGGDVTISASLVAAVTLGEGIEFASVRIKGRDHQGNTLAENFTFTDDNKADPQTSKRYFAEVTEVTSSGWAGGAIDIKGRDKACRVTIKPQDEEIVIFWNGEITRGLIPEVIDDMPDPEAEGETLTFRYREIDPGSSVILQDVAIMTGVIYNLKHERANDSLIKAQEEGRLEEYLQVLKNNEEHQSRVISLGLEIPIEQVDEAITHPIVRGRLASAIKGGAVPRLSTDEPTDIDIFPPEVEGQEPGETVHTD